MINAKQVITSKIQINNAMPVQTMDVSYAIKITLICAISAIPDIFYLVQDAIFVKIILKAV